jgi:Phage tail assembly chaperone proteins, E, or 41 or 14
MNVKPKKEGFVEDESVVATPLPAPEPEVEAPREVWPIKVRLLHREVRNNKGDMVSELSFREPTGGDINRYGNPVMIDQNGDVVILEKKMTTMMAVLSGVLQPFLEAMDPRDWNSCAYRLRNFFLPDPAAW